MTLLTLFSSTVISRYSDDATLFFIDYNSGTSVCRKKRFRETDCRPIILEELTGPLKITATFSQKNLYINHIL